MQAILDEIKTEIEANQTRLNELTGKFADDPVHAAQHHLQGVVKLSAAIGVKTLLLDQVKAGKELKFVVEKLIERSTRGIMNYEPIRSTCLVSSAIDRYNRSAELEIFEWLQELKAKIGE